MEPWRIMLANQLAIMNALVVVHRSEELRRQIRETERWVRDHGIGAATNVRGDDD